MPPTLYAIRHGQGEHNVNTAAYVFAPELQKRQLPVLLVPNAQEISSLKCDIGYDANVTKAEAPSLITDAAPSWNPANLDTTLVDDLWNSMQGLYAPTLGAVRQRAAGLRNWIFNRPEKNIVLVTHGGFLHYLTEDWTGYDRARGTGYFNCEYRKLEFTEDSNSEKSHLRECGGVLEKQDRPPGLDSHVIHEIEEVEKTSGCKS